MVKECVISLHEVIFNHIKNMINTCYVNNRLLERKAIIKSIEALYNTNRRQTISTIRSASDIVLRGFREFGFLHTEKPGVYSIMKKVDSELNWRSFSSSMKEHKCYGH